MCTLTHLSVGCMISCERGACSASVTPIRPAAHVVMTATVAAYPTLLLESTYPPCCPVSLPSPIKATPQEATTRVSRREAMVGAATTSRVALATPPRRATPRTKTMTAQVGAQVRDTLRHHPSPYHPLLPSPHPVIFPSPPLSLSSSSPPLRPAAGLWRGLPAGLHHVQPGRCGSWVSSRH